MSKPILHYFQPTVPENWFSNYLSLREAERIVKRMNGLVESGILTGWRYYLGEPMVTQDPETRSMAAVHRRRELSWGRSLKAA